REVGDPLVAGPPAGARKEDGVGGQLCAARPDLLPLDPPAAVDFGCPGAQGREVGSRLGFGEELAPDLLAGEDGTQEALLLGLRPEVRDGWAGEVLPDGVEPFRRAGSVALLVEDRPRALVETLPAVLARPGQAGISRLEQH